MRIEKPVISVAITDNHVLVRKALKNFLSHIGCKVILEAANGRELLERLPQSPLPDICLVDMNMPVMDGFETIHRLKSSFPSVRILASSFNTQPDRIKKILQCGADAFIFKAEEPAAWQKAIDRIIIAKEEIMQKGYAFVKKTCNA